VFIVVPFNRTTFIKESNSTLNGEKLMEEVRAQIAAGKLEAADIIKCTLGIRELSKNLLYSFGTTHAGTGNC
jgi:hypothetical protein